MVEAASDNGQNPNKPNETQQPFLSPEEVLSLPVEELIARLDTSTSGLSHEDADRRLVTYGPNEFARRKKRAAIIEFLLLFRSPLILILLFAAIISGIIGETPHVGIILSIIFISVFLDFYQQRKASQAAELLKEKVTTTATVLRDNVKQEVNLSQIVPGDIIYLSAGDIAPADARVITAKDLFMNQSALTGESFPVEKTIAPVSGADGILKPVSRLTGSPIECRHATYW